VFEIVLAYAFEHLVVYLKYQVHLSPSFTPRMVSFLSNLLPISSSLINSYMFLLV